jgi:hypothetical protein
VEDGGFLHAKLACGHGFWKVQRLAVKVGDKNPTFIYFLQELPDSICQILEAALTTLKNTELIHAAEESKIRKESEHAAAVNAEVAYCKYDGSTLPLDSDRSLSASSIQSASLSKDDVSEGSSQSM